MSQIVGTFEGEPSNFRDWIKSIVKYILLAGGDDIQTKRLAYQTSRGAVSDYIQRYMTENPNSSWADLKSELNVRFAEVNDSHHAFTMLHKARQSKMTPFRFMQKGYIPQLMMHLQRWIKLLLNLS